MTDGNLLKNAIVSAGVSIVFLAQKMGCSRNRLYSIIAGADCTASEITELAELLHLTTAQRDAIFFAQNSE
jgi:plasmid maintenance system antidote protein VapI